MRYAEKWGDSVDIAVDLALADLNGLDTVVSILEVMVAETGDPKYRPCPLLRRMVAAGRLGRKVGQGFYKY